MNESNEPKDPLLIDHEADGIRELDNKLPRWWVWLFNFSILFAVIYMVYYHVMEAGDLMAAQYDKQMQLGDKIKDAALAKFEATLETAEPSQESAVLDDGKRVFLQFCAPCHRPDGGGLVGPNLTDNYWIHGGRFQDNLKTIVNGVPSKGMVTWKGVLKPGEIMAVASYIYTLRGTQPPNPKPAENQAPAPAGPSEFE